jgi:hypothetical protein
VQFDRDAALRKIRLCRTTVKTGIKNVGVGVKECTSRMIRAAMGKILVISATLRIQIFALHGLGVRRCVGRDQGDVGPIAAAVDDDLAIVQMR